MRAAQQTLTLLDLRWLLASMTLVVAPMFLHLALWVPLFALLLGAWRYSLGMRKLPLPGTRVLLPMTLIGAGAIIASYGGSFGRDASVALLTLMLSMKLLESSDRRDAMLLISLSWFLSITTFLFTQSLLMGFYLALPIIALTPLAVIPLAQRFENEKPTARSIIGGVIAVAGVVGLRFSLK